MEDINFYEPYNLKEQWGCYAIQSDTIIIQVFNRNNMEFFKRQVNEFWGVIISDTSFLLLSGYNYLDKYQFQFLVEPVTYQFYPTQLKPDSTKAWFNNKRWYKNNLHESQKPE